ncbi:MAG: rod shape-determining protein RodA [Candidatus Omnitrophota bacterium]|nr:rod shape-determining protein RodA [Candidatus Omnitrophota bacterium]
MNANVRRLFVITFAIILIGLLTIYSASYHDGPPKDKNVFLRQLIWVVFGIAAFFVFANLNYRRFYDLSFVLYGLSISLLLLVLIFGKIRLGAQRWLELGGFNFQPSELAKFSLILFLSRYLSHKDISSVKLSVRDFGYFRSMVVPAVLAAIPAILVLEQPDLGTAVIFLLTFFSLIFISGVKKRYIFSLLAAGIFALPVFWRLLRDYQKERLLVFLNPNIDPLGAGYTVIQSKIAVGSGQLFGRGWLSGTQNTLNFLPERHTDFIFSCVAESSGFLGAFILLFLFYLLLRECMNIAYLTKDPFGRLVATGVAVMLSLQALINISMTIGLLPVVGIPLPLVSYGGTSMLVSCAGIGIIANISKRRMVF